MKSIIKDGSRRLPLFVLLSYKLKRSWGIMNGRIPSGFEAVKPNAFVLTSVNNGNNYSIIKMIQVINPLIGNRNGVAADVTIWSNMTRSQIIQTRNNPNTQRIIEAIEHIDLGLTNDNNDE